MRRGPQFFSIVCSESITGCVLSSLRECGNRDAGVCGLLPLGRRGREGGPRKGDESSFRGRSVTGQTQVLVKYTEASQGLSEDGGEDKGGRGGGQARVGYG